jgi:hypothetical protein
MAMTTDNLVERTPARLDWDAAGTKVLEGVISPDRYGRIVRESFDTIGQALAHVRDEAAAHRDGSFAAPFHCSFLKAGPVLNELCFDKQFLGALREATGYPRLIPRGGAVVVYQVGDFQGLHLDSVKSTVTVSMSLTEGLAPMGWAPAMRDAMPDDCAKVIAEQGLFPEGEEFQELHHPMDGAVRAFAGYNVPHWRAPMKVQGLMTTMSFMDL